jgi:ankyrin repeat protein
MLKLPNVKMARAIKVQATMALALFSSQAALAAAGSVALGPQLFRALRNGDTGAVRRLVDRGAPVNAANADGDTPLMYAAMYSTPATLELLLDRGAEPKAKTPAGTTALMLATADSEKVRLLLAKGANVNAQSVTGRTALLIAASRSGSGDVVRLLLAKGADANTKDHLQGMGVIPAGAGGSTALIEAAKIADGQALHLLLAAGADVHAIDNSGADALAAAVINGNTENARELLAHGAVAKRRVTPNEFTPLIFAAWRQDPALTRLLLSAGADPNEADAAGDTPLMWSAYNDFAATANTEALLAAGAHVNAHNKAGDTALSWARKRGETPVVKLLLAKGAADEQSADRAEATVNAASDRTVSAPADVRDAVAKSIALLQASSPQFVKVSGCVSCHNQALPQMATAMAAKHAIHTDPKLSDLQTKTVLGNIRPARLPLLEMSDVVPDLPITGPYIMLGLAADGYEPDVTTDALVLNLAAKQFPDGSWRPWSPRPPIEYSPVTATALSIRVLQIYCPPALRHEFDQRILAAREWLRRAEPRSNEEKAMRLLGLAWAKADESTVKAAAESLAADQRPDGGWAQLPTLASDAYATGQALYALRTAAVPEASSDVGRRASAYLLGTQAADGSWHVVSRAFPFQPYKESGMPYGKDQWISAAGTSWAVMALLAGN